MIVVTLKSKGPAKTLEQERCTKARKVALKALTPLLDGLDAPAKERMTDAFLEVSTDLHKAVHGAADTGTWLSARSGRIYPYTPKPMVSGVCDLSAKDVFARGPLFGGKE